MTSLIRSRLLQAGTVLAATLLATGAAAPVQAAPGDKASSSATQVKPEARKDRQICVSVEMTGSRVARRVCRTALQWQREGGIPSN